MQSMDYSGIKQTTTGLNGDVFTGVMTFDIYQDLLIKSILVSAVSLVL